MVFNPFIWTSDQLLMLGKVSTRLTNELKVLDITDRGSKGPVLDANLTKISIFDHLVLLNGLQPLHLDS